MFQNNQLTENIIEYIVLESLVQDGRSIAQIPSYFWARCNVKISAEDLKDPLRRLYEAEFVQIDWPLEYKNVNDLSEEVFSNCWFGLTPLGEAIYEESDPLNM